MYVINQENKERLPKWTIILRGSYKICYKETKKKKEVTITCHKYLKLKEMCLFVERYVMICVFFEI